jgi:hypothetical protein
MNNNFDRTFNLNGGFYFNQVDWGPSWSTSVLQGFILNWICEVALWIFQFFNALNLLLEMWVLVSMALNWFACLNKGSKLLSFSSLSLSYYGKSHKQPWSCKLYPYVIIYNDCEWCQKWGCKVQKHLSTSILTSSCIIAKHCFFLHLLAYVRFA